MLVGKVVGRSVGVLVGAFVGASVVGVSVGTFVAAVGTLVGAFDGASVVGVSVGAFVAEPVQIVWLSQKSKPQGSGTNSVSPFNSRAIVPFCFPLHIPSPYGS